MAYNLANFLRRLVLPRRVKHWSLRTFKEKLIKSGPRCVTFQMAEVVIPPALFAQIFDRIARLTPASGAG